MPPAGVEPATPPLREGDSVQLSYEGIFALCDPADVRAFAESTRGRHYLTALLRPNMGHLLAVLRPRASRPRKLSRSRIEW